MYALKKKTKLIKVKKKQKKRLGQNVLNVIAVPLGMLILKSRSLSSRWYKATCCSLARSSSDRLWMGTGCNRTLWPNMVAHVWSPCREERERERRVSDNWEKNLRLQSTDYQSQSTFIFQLTTKFQLSNHSLTQSPKIINQPSSSWRQKFLYRLKRRRFTY